MLMANRLILKLPEEVLLLPVSVRLVVWSCHLKLYPMTPTDTSTADQSVTKAAMHRLKKEAVPWKRHTEKAPSNFYCPRGLIAYSIKW